MSEEQINERLRNIELQNALLRQELTQLHDEIDRLNGGIGRALWIVGGGFIAAVVSWVVSGGLLK